MCGLWGMRALWVMGQIFPQTKLVTRKSYGLSGSMGYGSYGLGGSRLYMCVTARSLPDRRKSAVSARPAEKFVNVLGISYIPCQVKRTLPHPSTATESPPNGSCRIEKRWMDR